jgi:hypothetical protein
MSYPYLWVPIDISAKDISLLEGFQSKNIKRIVLPLRSHHSEVLMAMGIDILTFSQMKSKISLFIRIFKRNFPARILNAFFLARFLDGRGCIPGTLISSIVKANISPCSLAFTTQPRSFGPGGGVSATHCGRSC